MWKREDIVSTLMNGAATVKFKKLDGSDRSMLCTMAFHMIPEDKRPTGKMLTEVPIPGDQVRVFDLTLQDWRSFRVSNVYSISIDEEELPANKLLLE